MDLVCLSKFYRTPDVLSNKSKSGTYYFSKLNLTNTKTGPSVMPFDRALVTGGLAP